MVTDKHKLLKPLLESSDGAHLSVYLVNRNDPSQLKLQLVDAMNQAYMYLQPVMTMDEFTDFLEPLEALLHDPTILENIQGNIGMFRTRHFFRVVRLPVEVDSSCDVATSFHVKPLLKWMQTDREFLLLGLENHTAHLYVGSKHRLTRLGSFSYSEAITNRTTRAHQAFSRVNDWLRRMAGNTKPRLFIAGERELTGTLLKRLQYWNAYKEPIWASFSEDNLAEIAVAVRAQLDCEVHQKLDDALTEFRIAEDLNLTRKNIFEIAKAAAQGKVRKLIVADGIKIFGKIDAKSGTLKVHPFDLDHEDDDVLDDLAQSVLAQGGEVLVAPRDDIPNGHPALAILDFNQESIKETANDSGEFEIIKERFGGTTLGVRI